MKKYRTLRPFIAFGKAPEVGELIELTTEQAASLANESLIAPYEVKIEKPPRRAPKKKPSAASQAGRRRTKKTPKRSKKSATK